MDALLKSFVTKVHTRLHNDDDDTMPPDSVLHVLLPALSSTDPAVLSVTIDALSNLVDRSPPAHPEDALRALVRMMASEPCLEPDVRRRVGYLAVGLINNRPSITTRWPWRDTRALLRWYLQDPDAFFVHACLLLNALADCAGEIVAPEAAELLMPSVTTAVLERPEMCCTLYAALLGAVQDTASAHRFWTMGGTRLLDAVAEHRANHHTDLEGHALGILAHVATYAPREAAAFLGALQSDTLDTLCADVQRRGDAVLSDLELLLEQECVRAAWGGVPHLTRAFASRLAVRFTALAPDSQRTLLTHLLDLPSEHIDRSCVVRLWACVHADVTDDTKRRLACLVLQTLGVREILVALPSLVRLNDGTSDELDRTLCEVFERIRERPEHVCFPLRVHGSPSALLFHVIDLVAPPPLVSTTAFAERVREYLTEEILSGRSLETSGDLQYCEDLRTRYALDDVRVPRDTHDATESERFAACVPTCPITLQRMHCPVIASDGHTYELVALARSVRNGAGVTSPPTREDLQSWVVFNRVAYETDKQLTAALHQARARRTNRRWQAAQATGRR